MTYIYEECNVNDVMHRAQVLDRYDQLGGYDGLHALFDYYEQLAEDMGEPIQLDIIAWCCEWSHYDDIIDAASEYDHDDYLADLLADHRAAQKPGSEVGILLEVKIEEEITEWFRDNTQVIEYDNGVFIQSF